MTERQKLSGSSVIAWAEYVEAVLGKRSDEVRKGACLKAVEASDALALHDRETAAAMDTDPDLKAVSR